MKSKAYPNLFKEGRIGSRVVKNRIVMAPMSENMGNGDGTVSEQTIAYYEERAKGGAGMIIVGSVPVEFPRGNGVSNTITLDGERYILGWNRLARRVQAHGALLIAQLYHAGNGAWAGATHGLTPIDVNTLTTDDIEMLKNKWIESAVYAQMAGLDGVEVHSATGYLLSQFINPAVNQRTDEYGGSLENRTRLAREVIKGIREVVGPKFIVGSRIPVHKWDSDNLTDEESIQIAKMYVEAGVDYLNTNAGYTPKPSVIYETGRYEEGGRLDIPAKIKAAVDVPVISVGMLKDPEMCDKKIEEGVLDFAALGRALIADPFWPEKARQDRACDIRNCLSCLDGCLENVFVDLPIRCAVNPEVGFEFERNQYPAPKKEKTVLVIGGGVAGMQAAVTAKERGHKVILAEKSDKLGGQLNLAGIPPYKQYILKYRDWFVAELDRKGVDVVYNCTVDKAFLDQIQPDEVVLASGSRPWTPPIDGIENAVQAWDILGNVEMVPENKKVVIIGGGIVGCETASYLAQKGNDITILEMLPTLANGLDRFNKQDIFEDFEKEGVKAETSVKISKITDQAVETEGGDYGYDVLVVATGQRSAGSELIDLLDEEDYSYRIVGDAQKTGKIITANVSGYMAGLNI